MLGDDYKQNNIVQLNQNQQPNQNGSNTNTTTTKATAGTTGTTGTSSGSHIGINNAGFITRIGSVDQQAQNTGLGVSTLIQGEDSDCNEFVSVATSENDNRLQSKGNQNQGNSNQSNSQLPPILSQSESSRPSALLADYDIKLEQQNSSNESNCNSNSQNQVMNVDSIFIKQSQSESSDNDLVKTFGVTMQNDITKSITNSVDLDNALLVSTQSQQDSKRVTEIDNHNVNDDIDEPDKRSTVNTNSDAASESKVQNEISPTIPRLSEDNKDLVLGPKKKESEANNEPNGLNNDFKIQSKQSQSQSQSAKNLLAAQTRSRSISSANHAKRHSFFSGLPNFNLAIGKRGSKLGLAAITDTSEESADDNSNPNRSKKNSNNSSGNQSNLNQMNFIKKAYSKTSFHKSSHGNARESYVSQNNTIQTMSSSPSVRLKALLSQSGGPGLGGAAFGYRGSKGGISPPVSGQSGGESDGGSEDSEDGRNKMRTSKKKTSRFTRFLLKGKQKIKNLKKLKGAFSRVRRKRRKPPEAVALEEKNRMEIFKKKAVKSTNPNFVEDYSYLAPLIDILAKDPLETPLAMIAPWTKGPQGSTSTTTSSPIQQPSPVLNVADILIEKNCVPLFFFCGACPSKMSNHNQVVMFVFNFGPNGIKEKTKEELLKKHNNQSGGAAFATPRVQSNIYNRQDVLKSAANATSWSQNDRSTDGNSNANHNGPHAMNINNLNSMASTNISSYQSNMMMNQFVSRRGDQPSTGSIDFWWVKPDYTKKASLDKNMPNIKRFTNLDKSTLLKVEKGPGKNVPGSMTSGAFVAIADYFMKQKVSSDGKFRFGLELVERIRTPDNGDLDSPVGSKQRPTSGVGGSGVGGKQSSNADSNSNTNSPDRQTNNSTNKGNMSNVSPGRDQQSQMSSQQTISPDKFQANYNTVTNSLNNKLLNLQQQNQNLNNIKQSQSQISNISSSPEKGTVTSTSGIQTSLSSPDKSKGNSALAGAGGKIGEQMVLSPIHNKQSNSSNLLTVNRNFSNPQNHDAQTSASDTEFLSNNQIQNQNNQNNFQINRLSSGYNFNIHKIQPGQRRKSHNAGRVISSVSGNLEESDDIFTALGVHGATKAELIPKAYLEHIETNERSYIVMIWQECWASFTGKFIEGRLVYNKIDREWDTSPLYTREYHIKGDNPITMRKDHESCGFDNCFEGMGPVCIKSMIQGVEWKKGK